VLTLRTSLIGWELENHLSLMEWFAAQRGKSASGYRKAIFSGFTTQSMAALLEQIILQQPELSGLFHLASEPINKYDLLMLCKSKLSWQDIDLKPQDEFVIDRSLDGSELNAIMQWQIPSWTKMVEELCQDWLWYQPYHQGK
jgi:dTDP-4-dehydrorhamnose reductase